jgi:excinuclease ABC subunit C
MLDCHGVLIYVGKAKSLRTRLLSYFRPRSRDPKAGRILGQTRAILWEHAPSEFAALLRELELIRRWRPRFNVQGQPHRRRRTYVCLGRRPAPYVFLSARPPGNLIARYGPIHAGQEAREAVRRLNDWFRLRDCSQAQKMLFSDQAELFPVLRAAGCLRYEISTCLGPCAGACSRGDYQAGVQGAQQFLAGTDLAPLTSLECQMAAASAALQFERAAALRDKREVFRWLHDQLEHLKRAREQHSLIYPIQGQDGTTLWYFIRQGQVVAAAPAPQDEQGRQETAALVDAVYRAKRPKLGSGAMEEVDTVLLVAGWFRRYPEEHARTLTPEQALAHCRQPCLTPIPSPLRHPQPASAAAMPRAAYARSTRAGSPRG